jgi:division protein CdvB (Snf7/Vps24/ESCRT-III family)
MITYAGQGIYTAFAAAYSATVGMCAAQWTPPPTQKMMIQECHRDIRKSVRTINREISKQKGVESSLKSQIKALHAKHCTVAHRDILAKAYELRFLQKHTNKMYNYVAQLQGVSNELRSMVAAMSRANAIVDSTGLMRTLNALNPPAESLHMMREFAKQMQTAGLLNESVEGMFADRDDEAEEATDTEINTLIHNIVTNKPAPERKPIVIESLEGDFDADTPEDEEQEKDPEPLRMEKRLEALKS